ncbi:MAG TPA: glycosyltransferase family A protein [Acidimicrobiales bacterium]
MRPADRPDLSVVVVAYDMARELPRTLRSLSAHHQRGIDADDYELVVVDNGSPQPVDPALVADFPGRLRLERIDPAPPSPAHAANHGLRLAAGELVGLIVDGARLASPGLLAEARRAARLAPRPVVTAPAYHLGSETHARAAEIGYDQAVEDQLLARSGWEADGYRLFDISTPARSWGRGLFGPAGESSSLFCTRPLWDELGGLDERFTLPGGGLVNHDLYRRACALDDVELVVLLGEGTFHQYHGGAATSRRHTWDEMHAEYAAVTGRPHEPPRNLPIFVGHAHRGVLPFVERSARQAINRLARQGEDSAEKG